jgi:hypothetical protein
MQTIVAVNPAAVKTQNAQTVTITVENAHAVGVAYQFGINDGKHNDDRDAIFFSGELLTAYRLGFEVGVAEAQIEADAALVERAEIEEDGRSEYNIWF